MAARGHWLRHCERSEAIQDCIRGKILDCFAALAMTTLKLMCTTSSAVMPGLVPGIHVFLRSRVCVDGRDKPGHDEVEQIAET
jgi:hypothetical protein